MSHSWDTNIFEGLELLGFGSRGQKKAEAKKPNRTTTAKVGPKPGATPERAVAAKIGSKPPTPGPQKAVSPKIGFKLGGSPPNR
jgi:hypothetical protein